MFSSSFLLQVLACAIYSNWWPMLSALMYVLVPMPCMFFGGGSTEYLLTRDGGGWIDAAKFLTGASTVGSVAIPIILRLARLALMFSSSFPLQILARAIYSNWWPMLSALMYVFVPMLCMFFSGGSTEYLLTRDGGRWIDAAKFLTGASAVGSIAIPIILRHAHLIITGAMLINIMSFFIFVCTVMCFHRASLEDEW